MNLIGKKIVSYILLTAFLFGSSQIIGCGKPKQTVVKIGISMDEPEVWEAVQKNLDKDNIKLDIIFFSQYTWNQALANGELDMAAAQHHAWFEDNIKKLNLDLSCIGDMCTSPLNIFSKKYKSIDELPQNAKIAIPSDAVNLGRALSILEKAGLIKLNAADGKIPETSDIIENPLNIELVEIEGAQLPRSLQDVDAGVIQIGFAVSGGLDLEKENIFKDKIDKSVPEQYQYVRMFAVRSADINNETYKKVVKAYNSPEVAQVLKEVYKGTVEPGWD